MSNVKSIGPVQLYGCGNNGNWAARARLTDGSELFLGHGHGYTLAQAQAAISNTHILTDYKPLPAGVKAKA